MNLCIGNEPKKLEWGAEKSRTGKDKKFNISMQNQIDHHSEHLEFNFACIF